MEINTTNRACMVIEFFEEHLRSVVKHMNGAIVQRGEDPRAILVERETLNTFAFGLKLCLYH